MSDKTDTFTGLKWTPEEEIARINETVALVARLSNYAQGPYRSILGSYRIVVTNPYSDKGGFYNNMRGLAIYDISLRIPDQLIFVDISMDFKCTEYHSWNAAGLPNLISTLRRELVLDDLARV